MKLKLLHLDGGAITHTREVGSMLVQDEYTDQKEVGFSISQVTTEVIHGKFLEKRTRKFQIFSVSGEPSFIEVPSVNIIQFGIYSKPKFLVLHDQGGSMSSFISRLGLLSGHRITAELAIIPVGRWIAYYREVGFDLSVKEVTTTHIPVGRNVEATIRLRGEVALSAVTSGQFMDKTGDVINAQFACRTPDGEFLFTWKSTGSYEFDPAPADSFVPSLLNFLASSDALGR